MAMKFPEWKEAVAAAGVILSLLFVAYEIRQSTQVARAQARQELAALNQQWLITSPVRKIFVLPQWMKN